MPVRVSAGPIASNFKLQTSNSKLQTNMGIMLILKGATYTPPTTNPGNPSDDTPQGGEQPSVLGYLAPDSMWIFLSGIDAMKGIKEGNASQSNSGTARYANDTANRFIAFWKFPEGATRYKLYISQFPQYDMEDTFAAAIPTADPYGTASASTYAAGANLTYPEGFSSSYSWYRVGGSADIEVDIPDGAAGLCIWIRDKNSSDRCHVRDSFAALDAQDKITGQICQLIEITA